MAFTQGLPANRAAFLDMTGWSEGTIKGRHPLTQNDGYDVLVTGVNGPAIFTDYSKHPFFPNKPSIVVNSKGLKSSASGRYQHMLKDWVHYRDLLKLPDFGPASQDKWCLQLIRERGALDEIDRGEIGKAILLVSNLWASFPGAGYGQFEHKLQPLLDAYARFGGRLA